MDLVSNIMNIDRRIIYFILILALLVPLVKPFGLPLTVSSDTKSAYDTINSLPEGSIAILSTDYTAAGSPEYWPQTDAFTKHMMSRGIKILSLTFTPEGGMFAERAMKENAPRYNYTYGEDYVVLPYKAGKETGVAALGRDLKGLYPVDFYGTSCAELPLMSRISGIKDISLVVAFSGGDEVAYYVQQIRLSYGIPIVAGVSGVMYAQYVPYMQSGQLSGLLAGLRGAAEYEKLIDQPSSAIAGMDAQSMAHLYVIILIALGNAGYFISRRRQTKEAATHE